MDHKLEMLLSLAGLLMVLMVDQADSECCLATPTGCVLHGLLATCNRECDDGTEPTPYCGYGPCNILGCNCDGGCRHKKRSVADPEQVRSLLEFLEGEKGVPGIGYHDVDRDFELERVVEEARSLLELLRGEQENIYREENARALREFGHYDANGDMKLSQEEALQMLKDLRNGDISGLPEDWFKNMDKNSDGYIDPEELAMAKDSPPAE